MGVSVGLDVGGISGLSTGSGVAVGVPVGVFVLVDVGVWVGVARMYSTRRRGEKPEAFADESNHRRLCPVGCTDGSNCIENDVGPVTSMFDSPPSCTSRTSPLLAGANGNVAASPVPVVRYGPGLVRVP